MCQNMVEKEPTFCIEIRACKFANLKMEQLTRKLKLMHDMNLTMFYTIREDTNDGEKIPADEHRAMSEAERILLEGRSDTVYGKK